MVVTPYYNKGTEEGLFLHFSAIAAAVHIPIILYNVPSRTGVDLSVSLCRRLAQIPNISGIKEASTDMGKILKLRTLCPEDFCIWSGNDDLTVPVLSLGGKGVISVASNVLPEQVQAMAKAALAGDFDSASALQIWLQPLTELLFSEVNPVPVKTAMGLLGYACGECRLPLSPMTPENVRRLKNLLSSF